MVPSHFKDHEAELGSLNSFLRSRLTQKFAKVRKNTHAHIYIYIYVASYIAVREENQIDTYAYENGISNVLFKGFPGVNPVVMNYKIRHG